MRWVRLTSELRTSRWQRRSPGRQRSRSSSHVCVRSFDYWRSSMSENASRASCMTAPFRSFSVWDCSCRHCQRDPRSHTSPNVSMQQSAASMRSFWICGPSSPGLRPAVLTRLYDKPTASASHAPAAGARRVSQVPGRRKSRSRRAFEDRLNAIGDTNQAIVDGVDVDTIFRRLAHSARALSDAESAIISTLRPGDRDTLVLRALVLREQDVPRTERLHPDDLFEVDDTVLAHPVRTGQPFIFEDVQHTSDPSLQRIRQLGIGAAVAVPLAVRGQVFGG